MLGTIIREGFVKKDDGEWLLSFFISFILENKKEVEIMAGKTTTISVRIDTELKVQAESLFKQLGFNFSTAINIFVQQAVREGRIPFEVSTNSEFYKREKQMLQRIDVLENKTENTLERLLQLEGRTGENSHLCVQCLGNRLKLTDDINSLEKRFSELERSSISIL